MREEVDSRPSTFCVVWLVEKGLSSLSVVVRSELACVVAYDVLGTVSTADVPFDVSVDMSKAMMVFPLIVGAGAVDEK